MRVWFTRFLHDVGVGRACRHQSVTAHVVVLNVVSTLHRVVERLSVSIVRSDHKVLHVLHAGTFETGHIPLAMGPGSLFVNAYGLLAGRGRGIGRSAMGVVRENKVYAKLVHIQATVVWYLGSRAGLHLVRGLAAVDGRGAEASGIGVLPTEAAGRAATDTAGV